MITKAKGIMGEQVAIEYLVKDGYRILGRNFSCKMGEIDIIALKDGVIVFVEVKSRNFFAHGSGLESVTPDKISKIVRTADLYLTCKRKTYADCRFDVILTNDEEIIEHIPNAFTRADAGRKKHW